MGRVAGKVAFITGAARGQGRSHAIRLAEEGADIIGVDICAQLDTVPYPMSRPEDLKETVRLVEKTGRRMLGFQADTRDLGALQAAVEQGVAEFGRLDTVVANACTLNGTAAAWELTEEQFEEQVGVGLGGTWRTVKATVPHLIDQGQGGSVILISSTSGLAAELHVAHYVAAKTGVTGLMRALSAELAPHMIRVNSIHPTNVHTPMIENQHLVDLFAGGRPGFTFGNEEIRRGFQNMNALPVPWLDPVDISNAVLYLASDETRYVTGTTHVVDAGALAPFKHPHDYS
ncbi:mycofactocin-coupled SDR family oxidoreductase [Streptomyces sp. NPDC004237]|uniref:mycofactocin-coupled SDR family oxidoreductase n=1 Tax=Streptomyces sp. NPDC004237 TaxID=3154455 RepID=UPI0033B244E6